MTTDRDKMPAPSAKKAPGRATRRMMMKNKIIAISILAVSTELSPKLWAGITFRREPMRLKSYSQVTSSSLRRAQRAQLKMMGIE